VATCHGAYGLRIEGLDEAGRWMQRVSCDAPVLTVACIQRAAAPVPSHVDADSADIHLQALADARMRIERRSGRVTYLFPRTPAQADLLHPYLLPAAALAHAWCGREALHAGAFCTTAGAVIVLGDKEGGKSSTLAWIARELELPVQADDLVVLQGGAVLAGPRCIDLRTPTATRYGALWSGDPVRLGSRLRLSLPQAVAAAPVIGCTVLGWGQRLRLAPVPPAGRLRLLAPQRFVGGLDADPVAILDLAALPMLHLQRPPSLDGLPATAEALVRAWT
jgi:hypothetical protein